MAKVASPNFNLFTVSELKNIARARGLTGYSRLRRNELLDLLQKLPTNEKEAKKDDHPQHTMENISTDMLYEIIKLLDINDIHSICTSSKKFAQICSQLNFFELISSKLRTKIDCKGEIKAADVPNILEQLFTGDIRTVKRWHIEDAQLKSSVYAYVDNFGRNEYKLISPTQFNNITVNAELLAHYLKIEFRYFSLYQIYIDRYSCEIVNAHQPYELKLKLNDEYDAADVMIHTIESIFGKSTFQDGNTIGNDEPIRLNGYLEGGNLNWTKSKDYFFTWDVNVRYDNNGFPQVYLHLKPVKGMETLPKRLTFMVGIIDDDAPFPAFNSKVVPNKNYKFVLIPKFW